MYKRIKNIFPFIKEIILISLLHVIAVYLTAQENSGTKEIKAAFSELDSRGEIYFSIPLEGTNLQDLATMLSVHDVQGDSIYAFANKKGFREFLTLNLPFHLKQFQSPPMLNKRRYDVPGFYYPTYHEYVQLMESYANDFPGICSLIVAGESVLNRKILFLKITGNPGLQEAEPEFMFSAAMHGNETAGYPLMIKLIDSLLNGYDENAHVKKLVDNMEIWINPLANPDGMYNAGNNSVLLGTRFNANNIDLNRNFPDPVNGDHPDDNPWQPETDAMMHIMKTNNFVLSANFHSGTEVVNYPWDSFSSLHPDNDWYISISRQYADTVFKYSTAYFDSPEFNYGIINGYEFYPVHGGRQDYMNYFMHGREVTIEISDDFFTPGDELAKLWDYNKRSLFGMFQHTMYGIHGLVSDSATGDPLHAKISILSHDKNKSFVYADSDAGDFYRMLLPGIYHLEISVDGYLTKYLNVTLDETKKKENLNITLVKDATWAKGLMKEVDFLFTNPVKEQIKIYFPGSTLGDKNIKILDLNGRVFHDQTYSGIMKNVVINTAHFHQGIYLMSVVIREEISTRKIIVIKNE